MGNGEERPTSTALVARDTMGALDVGTVGECMILAKQLCKSSLVPKALQGQEADTLLVMLTGRSLGINSIAALRAIYVFHTKDGRTIVGLDATLYRALAQRHPDCEYLTMIEDGSNGRATWETKRRGHPKPVRMSWTMDDAKRAGLSGKDNWTKFPAAMLSARASVALVRAIYPEAVTGIYSRDEAEDAAETIDVETTYVEDTMLRPERKPTPAAQPGPRATSDQRAQIKVLTTHLGAETASAIALRCRVNTADLSAADAALLIDTLTSEAEARATAQPAPKQEPAPATASQSPGDMQAPPAGDLWPAGRE